MRVHKYKLDSMEHYHKDTLYPLYLKFHELKQKIKTHSTWMKVILVSIHMAPHCLQSQMVNDSNIQEVLERDSQTQVTNMSDRVQNQSSRKALMAPIRARRYFIESTGSSSDMNPDSAVVIEDTFVKTTQALNRVTDEEPSVTCSNNKDYLDETSVYEDSYTLDH